MQLPHRALRNPATNQPAPAQVTGGSAHVSESRRLAAIDIGTVTTRLLVADVSAAGVTEVARSTDITYLGEGLGATGRLSEAAMGRVAAVLACYGTIIAG